MGVQVNELAANKPWQNQFIDFTFKGIKATELGLVAVSDGDWYNSDLMAPFQDETSEVNGVNGQYFWGSRFQARERTYKLATDGITDQQLRKIKMWLKPGEYGKLIDNSALGRYCYCRINKAPAFKFIPFEKTATLLEQEISVTEYKGEIEVTFIQDNPFMYAEDYILNIEGLSEDNKKEALYKIYTNQIPTSNTTEDGTTVLLGNDNAWHTQTLSLNSTKTETPLCYYNPSEEATELDIKMSLEISTNFSREKIFEQLGGYRSQDIPEEYTESGFAKASLLKVKLDQAAPTGLYFNMISNKYTQSNTLQQSNFIVNKVGDTEYTYKYGLPSIFSEINRAIKIASEYYNENRQTKIWSIAELFNRIKKEIINSKVLNWAGYCLGIPAVSAGFISNGMLINREKVNILKNNVNTEVEVTPNNRVYVSGFILKDGTGSANSNFVYTNWFAYFNLMMLCLFARFSETDPGSGSPESMEQYYDSQCVNNNYYPTISYSGCRFRGWYIPEINYSTNKPVFIEIDGKNSECVISYKYNVPLSNKVINCEVKKDDAQGEKCGDIMYSEYPKLQGGNSIDSNGKPKDYSILKFIKDGELIDNNNLSVNVQYEYKYL